MAVSKVRMQRLTPLAIRDRATLDSASAVAHDGVFRLSDTVFDEQSAVFRLAFHLPDTELAHYRRIMWPISLRYMPFARWELMFSSVQSCQIRLENDTNVNSLPLEIASLRLDPDDSKITIVTHFVVTIELVVSILSGELRQLSGDSPMAPLSSLVIRANR